MSTMKTSRELPAPPEAVFAAIVDRERLARWWGPAGFRNTFSICEIKPGGRWVFTMHGPDGKDYPNESVFEEVVAPSRIVIRHVCEPKFVLTIGLSPSSEGTRVDWEGVFENAGFVEKAADFLRTANEQNLDRLAAEVARAREIRFDDAEGYERYMGAWSRLAGERFLSWLSPANGGAWLDIGCGNGAFTELLYDRCAPAEVHGIDPAEAQLDYARRRLGARGARFQKADAMKLPFPDSAFDATVLPLVIFFIPDPLAGAREARRVVRKGGTVSAYAWDMEGGGFPYHPVRAELESMGLPSMATPPSPAASRLDEMGRLWKEAGLAGVETAEIVVTRDFASFDDYWETIHKGPNLKTGLKALSADAAAELKGRLRRRLGEGPDGRLTCTARAHAVKGRVA